MKRDSGWDWRSTIPARRQRASLPGDVSAASSRQGEADPDPGEQQPATHPGQPGCGVVQDVATGLGLDDWRAGDDSRFGDTAPH